jgi:hypothetical protein
MNFNNLLNNKEKHLLAPTTTWAKQLYQPSSSKAQTWKQELALSLYQQDYHEYLSCIP